MSRLHAFANWLALIDFRSSRAEFYRDFAAEWFGEEFFQPGFERS